MSTTHRPTCTVALAAASSLGAVSVDAITLR